jgi:alkanesulfonate monooxygenase SsuD/methylene tetrahydromethanopterin reductase-like flavin-dependent oxidoreductase (luciferase family)
VKIGPLLVLGENEEVGSVRSYAELRRLALTAESSGLDTVWVYDHLLYHFEGKEPQGVWECWTIWSALAEATSRVELGALVLCTAFRNPAVLAKMAITLDEVSEGRVILGLGAGWNKPEFDAFGLEFERKVDQFEEAVSIIAPLVREGHVDFQGEFHEANDCLMAPAPQRRIPILIAAKQPRMMRLTARYADAFNTAWHGHVESIEPRVTALREACEAEGRDPDSIELTVGVNVAFPDLGEVPEGAADPQMYLSGSIEEVATGLRAYQERGVHHVMTQITPHTPEAIEWLGRAAHLVNVR